MRIVKLNENYLKEILEVNNHINKTIAIHQALKIGELRDSVNSVSGLFEIEIPNQEEVIKFIDRINKSISEGNNLKVENIASYRFILYIGY